MLPCEFKVLANIIFDNYSSSSNSHSRIQEIANKSDMKNSRNKGHAKISEPTVTFSHWSFCYTRNSSTELRKTLTAQSTEETEETGNKLDYRKVPKFSDARNFCCNLPKTQTKRPNLRVFCQIDENGIANSEDPDQTAPVGAV